MSHGGGGRLHTGSACVAADRPQAPWRSLPKVERAARVGLIGWDGDGGSKIRPFRISFPNPFVSIANVWAVRS